MICKVVLQPPAQEEVMALFRNRVESGCGDPGFSDGPGKIVGRDPLWMSEAVFAGRTAIVRVLFEIK
jgi:hypothetical protein